MFLLLRSNTVSTYSPVGYPSMRRRKSDDNNMAHPLTRGDSFSQYVIFSHSLKILEEETTLNPTTSAAPNCSTTLSTGKSHTVSLSRMRKLVNSSRTGLTIFETKPPYVSGGWNLTTTVFTLTTQGSLPVPLAIRVLICSGPQMNKGLDQRVCE